MERIITTIALVVGFAIVVALPGAYYSFSRTQVASNIGVEAEINARLMTEIVNANPDVWHFQLDRIAVILDWRPDDGSAEARRVVLADGTVVAASDDGLPTPILLRTAPIYDSGREVARLEVARSLRPTWTGTGLAAALGLVLALAAFLAVRTLPLRALRVAMDALASEQAAKHEIDRERARAEAATLAKSQFLASMSHEIRTPMNGVLGMTELLLETGLNGTQRRYAQTIRSSGEALLNVINDILDLSKIEAGRLELDPVEVEPHVVAEEAMQLLALRAQEKGLEVNCQFALDVPPAIRVDAMRLRQILLNLLGNAIKFTTEGEVTLTVGVDAHAAATDAGEIVLHFSVTDTGAGIPKAAQERLFADYEQADKSTARQHGGTGLGLAVCRRLVELMGGTIGVDSEPGHGATFWFTIRAQRGAAASPAAVPAGLAGLRILVVEDNETNRAILLQRLTGYGLACRTAVDGLDGLAALRDAAREGQPFHVALVDMKMPRMTGIELARAVRQDTALVDTRLVMLTSLSGHGDAAAARAAGFDFYLTKPVSRSDLNTVLSKTTGVEPTIVPGTATAPAAPDPLQGLHVLIAEDNPVNAEIAQELVRSLGCTVDLAEDGQEAIDAVARTRYDLVLMDCQMPNVDGYAATRHIREAAVNGGRTLPIIAVTANAMPEDRRRCIDARMTDFVAKPYRPDTLAEAIERCLGSRGASTASREQAVTPALRVVTDGSNLPAFDAEAFQRTLPGGADPHSPLPRRVMTLFVRDTERLLRQLDKALAESDVATARRVVHSLKSSGAVVGAKQFADVAKRMEGFARDGDLGSMAPYAVRLRDGYTAFCAIPAVQLLTEETAAPPAAAAA